MNRIYTNSLTNNGDQLFWTDLYTYVFRVNSAIEGISQSQNITQSTKRQLLGEAKFLRAFFYFYLINFYGDVPLLLSTDIKVNNVASRTSTDEVYKQVIADLIEAKESLSTMYLAANLSTESNERLRPNKFVASALLARVYLYVEKWDLAEQEANFVIDGTSKYTLESLTNVFLKDSREAIWQLQPVNAGMNTFDAAVFVLAAGDGRPEGPDGQAFSRPVYLSNQLCENFELSDRRKLLWIGNANSNGRVYPYAFKYKAWIFGVERTEYLVVFRLAELYLIRSESRLMQGRLTGDNSAETDLNIIRRRSGLENLHSSDKLTMLTYILNEKRSEFFTEWGHRWLDLKRTGKIDQVMILAAPLKGGSWTSYKALYPIPVNDIKRNPSLRGHQNPGYPEI